MTEASFQQAEVSITNGLDKNGDRWVGDVVFQVRTHANGGIRDVTRRVQWVTVNPGYSYHEIALRVTFFVLSVGTNRAYSGVNFCQLCFVVG